MLTLCKLTPAFIILRRFFLPIFFHTCLQTSLLFFTTVDLLQFTCFVCLCVCVSPDAQFVRVAPLSETDNPEDDKVYVFFTERAQEAEGAAGKVMYSRVARVCKVRSVYADSKQVFCARIAQPVCMKFMQTCFPASTYVPISVCLQLVRCVLIVTAGMFEAEVVHRVRSCSSVICSTVTFVHLDSLCGNF